VALISRSKRKSNPEEVLCTESSSHQQIIS